MRIASIELKITLDDGEVVEGSMSAEHGEQRWGNDISHLAACVEPMEAMNAALSEGGHWASEDDDEPWSCDNCGNTDQDGSDVCVDCGQAIEDESS